MPVDASTATAPLLKLLGEPLRWEIVQRLAVEDLCTCHLVDDLDTAQPLISHHLKILRNAGVVGTEPCGAFTYYVLDRQVIARLAEILGGLAIEPAQRRRRPCS